MTQEELIFWKDAIQNICFAWCVGAIFIGIGIGSISIKNIFNGKKEDK